MIRFWVMGKITDEVAVRLFDLIQSTLYSYHVFTYIIENYSPFLFPQILTNSTPDHESVCHIVTYGPGFRRFSYITVIFSVNVVAAR